MVNLHFDSQCGGRLSPPPSPTRRRATTCSSWSSRAPFLSLWLTSLLRVSEESSARFLFLHFLPLFFLSRRPRPACLAHGPRTGPTVAVAPWHCVLWPAACRRCRGFTTNRRSAERRRVVPSPNAECRCRRRPRPPPHRSLQSLGGLVGLPSKILSSPLCPCPPPSLLSPPLFLFSSFRSLVYRV